MDNKLRIGIPTGILQHKVISILAEAGIYNQGEDNPSIAVSFMDSMEILDSVKSGILHCGITMSDTFVENGMGDLSFSLPTEISLLRSEPYIISIMAKSCEFNDSGIYGLNGKVIATPYSKYTNEYLSSRGINAEIIYVPNIGDAVKQVLANEADAVAELCETIEGVVVEKNDLKPIAGGDILTALYLSLLASRDENIYTHEIMNSLEHVITGLKVNLNHFGC